MTDKEYAVSNLRTTAESVSAYASFATNSVNDSEIYERIMKAEQAVRDLAEWIERH